MYGFTRRNGAHFATGSVSVLPHSIVASEKHKMNSVAASIAAPRMRSNREDGNEGSSRSGSGSVNIRYSTQKPLPHVIPPRLFVVVGFPHIGVMLRMRWRLQLSKLLFQFAQCRHAGRRPA